MNEFSISDYSIFSDAINSVNSINEKIETTQTSINECKNLLDKDTVFMGPICDSCIEGFTEINGTINDLMVDFSTIAKYLNEVSIAYATGDENAKNKVLQIDSSTNRLVTSNFTIGNTQASSFNELGDRAYEGDKAAQQEWIEKVAQIVDASQYSKYGLKNSLIIAQIINESGWMHTPQTKNPDGSTLTGNNNILGINTDMDMDIDKQDSTWSQKRKSTDSNVTQWDDNGNKVGSEEAMRTYDSIEECIEDYANVLYLYHPECKGSNNLEDYRTFLERYTPNPNQSTTDMYAGIISMYDLEKYDR